MELTNEEMQRAMEFIIQQQAQYGARIERDESRLARLEEYFQVLVELARGADERYDTMGESMATLSHTMNELVRRTITSGERLDQDTARFERDEARLAGVEESITMLAELARRADERQDTMGETMATLSHTMNELALSLRMVLEVQSQTDARVTELARRTDERSDQDAARVERDAAQLARLEESFTMLVELAHRHG